MCGVRLRIIIGIQSDLWKMYGRQMLKVDLKKLALNVSIEVAQKEDI